MEQKKDHGKQHRQVEGASLSGRRLLHGDVVDACVHISVSETSGPLTPQASSIPCQKPKPRTMVSSTFFQRDVLVVARELVGVELVWRGCSGLIVETEAYAAEGDAACPSPPAQVLVSFSKRCPQALPTCTSTTGCIGSSTYW